MMAKDIFIKIIQYIHCSTFCHRSFVRTHHSTVSPANALPLNVTPFPHKGAGVDTGSDPTCTFRSRVGTKPTSRQNFNLSSSSDEIRTKTSWIPPDRSEEHTSELQSTDHLV